MSYARYLFAVGLLAVALGACGSSSDNGDGAAGSGATGAGGSKPLITIELPPDVEKRLTQLLDELSAIVCQRSQNCCAGYGLAPLSDCRELAGGVFALRASNVLVDGPESFDYSIDEAYAAACLAAARSVVDDCTFASEPLVYAWFSPCLDALVVTKKGESPRGCRDDDDCTTRVGPGQRCHAGACLPVSEVATGSSCKTPENPTSIPVCGANDYCDQQSVCVARAPLGGACFHPDSCLEPYACVYRVIDADTGGWFCAEKGGVGARCQRDDQCAEGACGCSPDVGCAKSVCAHLAHFGDACATDDDCYGVFATCENARCTPLQLSLCQ